MNGSDTITIIIADSEAEGILDSVLKIRHEVFIKGQNVPAERDIDGLDDSSTHVLLKHEGEDVACARIRNDGSTFKIERLAVLDRFRGLGLSRLLMIKILGYGSQHGAAGFKIHAQKYLENYYRTFGFESYGDYFMDAGIEHIEMTMKN